MPVISFVSSKGGVGKTTAALLLAGELASRGAPVTLLDADPNAPLTRWRERGGEMANLKIVSDVSHDNIQDEIERADQSKGYVLVDLEGTASLAVSFAIGSSDFVIVPMQGSQLDADEAAKAIKLIHQTARQANRPIPHAVLLTRTSPAIRPRNLMALRKQLNEHKVPVFDAQLSEREAFKSIFTMFRPLNALDGREVSGLDKARDNANEFAAEAFSRVRSALAGAPSLEVAG